MKTKIVVYSLPDKKDGEFFVEIANEPLPVANDYVSFPEAPGELYAVLSRAFAYPVSTVPSRPLVTLHVVRASLPVREN